MRACVCVCVGYDKNICNLCLLLLQRFALAAEGLKIFMAITVLK